ncbi:hypothetical protein [Paraburkholderia sp. BCC1886]|uniref:hypothetical protein n=1 Tax=Paraburkholderia sp. BCC1886 TaxID=2562670 RepID=UPI001182B9C6|nr:hypothetical protein [Paraburkholderia sp. BCC1886]
MTLPPPYENETLKSIEASLGDNPMSRLEELQANDLALIAKFIQTFNVVEFNLRRALSVLILAGLIPPKKRILPADLVLLTTAAVEKMNPATENIPDTLARLQDLEIRRQFRNLLAHWAAKRIHGADALFLMSHDERDANQVKVGPLGWDYAAYAIVRLSDLLDQIQRIVDHDRWLAPKTAEWLKRYSR